MRDFNLLDTGSFKAFYFAAETLNFTRAAAQAGMTQSGVSQHVAKLESQLGAPLFLRVNRKVHLTDAGRKLRAYVEKFIDEVEGLRESIGQDATLLSGFVSYAMPASCLMSPHFSLLLKERNKSFPGVDLKVTICPSEEVIRKLLSIEIDFGFVTKNTGHPAVVFSTFCPEEYILVGASREPSVPVSAKTLREMRFLHHPGVEVLFEYWVSHHFPRAAGATWDSLNVVGEINSLQGVIDMVRGGLGVTILPRHCVAPLLREKEIFEYKVKGATPVSSQIYLVTRAEQIIPKRVQTVIDTFFAMKS